MEIDIPFVPLGVLRGVAFFLAVWGGGLVVVLLALRWLFPPLTRQRPTGVSARERFPVRLAPGWQEPTRRARPPRPTWTTPDLPPIVIEETESVAAQDRRRPGVYWRQNRRLIGALLLIWAAAFVVPSLAAPWLNQVTILGGFPLGYYMGAQGALLVFLALTLVYTARMTRLDRAFGGGGRKVDPRLRRRVLRREALFVGGLLLAVAVFAALETRVGLPPAVIDWAFIAFTIGVYAVVGLRNRTTRLDEYYVAGRSVPAIFNGLAIAADWMSAATFISLAGTLWLLGYEGLAYIMGWTGGYVLLVLLLAPYVRKFGQYTVPDLIGARFASHGARVLAAVMGALVSFVYLTAQVTGVGLIMSRFLGVNFLLGVLIGLGAVLFCSYLGGMRAVTWTQTVQGMILIVAFLLPVVLLARQDTGIPLPQLVYGAALQRVEQLEAAQGITPSYVEPFNDWTPWHFLALTLCLMCGTAGLPHIIMRFYTTPTVRQARRSASWALVFITLVYLTIPAYAAFSRWEILQNVIGRPVSGLPEWAVNWAGQGLLTIDDENGDGILQYSELKIHPDLVVLATPEIVNLPHTIAALVAAGGLAAALSTADGLLIVITSAVAHDIYFTAHNRRASPRRQLQVGRVTLLVVAVVASLTALRRLGIIVELVAWAFSLAAATLFPALVVSIFWRRANRQGVIAGMASGFVVTLGYILVSQLNPAWTVLGITSPAAGIFGMPVNFLVTLIVSRLTPPPPPETQLLVEALRRP